MAMKDSFNNLPPKVKLYGVIGLAVLALFGTLYATVGDDDGIHREVRTSRDKQISVLTDTDNGQIGLENVSGRVKYNDARIQNLTERLERMQKERDAEKNNTARDRAWQERFEALTSEIQRQNAVINELREKTASAAAFMSAEPAKRSEGEKAGTKQTNKTSDKSGKNTAVGSNPENISTEVVSEDMFSREVPAAVDANGTPVKAAPIKISVISEEKPEKPAPEKSDKGKDEAFYIPAGSIITGTILTGGDYPTGSGSNASPTPALIRVSKTAILPNRYVSDIRECFLLASGHGELASERAQLRGESLSCIRRDGKIIETRLAAYVAGEDGKAGVKGRLVSKQGQMIARTLVSGFMSGMAEAFDYDPVPVLATSSTGTVQYQENFSSEAAKGGLAKGLMNSLDRVSEFYMDLAEQMVPVVEVNAGRQVDIIVTAGTTLKVKEAATPVSNVN